MTARLPLFLLESSAPRSAWFPFAGVRPIADLRAGALRLRERWVSALGAELRGIVDAGLGEMFTDIEALPLRQHDAIVGPCVVARSDAAPALRHLSRGPDVQRLRIGDETVAWFLDAGERWHGIHETGVAAAIDGLLLRGAHDLVTALERLLADDITALAEPGRHALPSEAIVLGDAALVQCRSARVEPGVVFDVRNGPILLEADVEVRHGTRLEGPLYVAHGSRLLGGDIRGCSIGPKCTVRGELSSSCLLGYANKGHEGFVGHSVLGHWVNLGAGTTTSNLKNTYGSVRLDAPTGRIDTGRQFLGTLFGDHAKTAIGTLFSTGSLVGAGANLFGGAPRKCTLPMAWGSDGGDRLTRAGFLAIAERVLPRRQISWSADHAATLGALYDRHSGS